jgi:GNAT superfamily N-acetyltransferase
MRGARFDGQDGTMAETRVRRAGVGDIPRIAELSALVQAHLDAAGSAQRFGPLAPDVIARHVAAGTAYVLQRGDLVVGGAFAGPVSAATFPELVAWRLAETAPAFWFLSKVMIAPALQGQGLGDVLLDGIRRQLAAPPGSLLALDCWAGNGALRTFYMRAGFHLHGIFAEDGYDVAVFTWRVPPASAPPAG